MLFKIKTINSSYKGWKENNNMIKIVSEAANG